MTGLRANSRLTNAYNEDILTNINWHLSTGASEIIVFLEHGNEARDTCDSGWLATMGKED